MIWIDQRGKPMRYTDDEWEKYINFWNDPANAQRAETNRLNRSKSTVKMTSATQEEPSEIDTFYRLHTRNVYSPKILRLYRMYIRMRELRATGYVRSRLSYTAPVDRSRDVDFMMNLMRSDNRFADAFARYDSGGASGSGGSRAVSDREEGDDTGDFSPATCRWGKILPLWHQFLDQKIRGAHFSLGIVAGERFAIELTPSTFPQRHFAGDMFPQRHVAGEKVGMLLGKASNVVVLDVTCSLMLHPKAQTNYIWAKPIFQNFLPSREGAFDRLSEPIIQSLAFGAYISEPRLVSITQQSHTWRLMTSPLSVSSNSSKSTTSSLQQCFRSNLSVSPNLRDMLN
ncbi:hypothetical protein Tco_0364249 [Tanacetum coccineum]